jgi:dynein intermediate chain 2
LVAVGAQDGTMTILELSSSLSKLQNNEKSIFSAMLEREAKREKTLEGIAREKRLKAAQKRPQSGAAKLATTEAMDEILTSTEEEFFKAIDDGSGSFRDEAQARIREFNDTLQQQQQGSA